MTSSNNMYRNPAWAGMNPQPLLFEIASPEDTAMITDSLGEEGRVSKLLLDSDSLRGFRFEGVSGTALFVKVVSDFYGEHLKQAEMIGHWLQERGIHAGSAIDHIAGPNQDLHFFIYPFFDLAHMTPTKNDIVMLGSAIGKLHTVLAEHPDRMDWNQKTRNRLNKLKAIRKQLSDGSLRVGPYPDELISISQNVNLSFEQDENRAIPLHGDLNPNNVLKDLGANKPVFLDFEDTMHSVIQPELELAYVIERHILLQVDDDTIAKQLVYDFTEAYTSSGCAFSDELIKALSMTLKVLALRSMCILADAEHEGRSVCNSEWIKFLTLYKHAGARMGVFI